MSLIQPMTLGGLLNNMSQIENVVSKMKLKEMI